MQGSFPIAPRPYRASPSSAESPRRRCCARVAAPARRAHHPPGHADLRHARARLLLDARRGQGRPRAPAPRRAGHQRAPGRLAQLPAQPRVQHVVHDRHRARLAARPGGHARGARREAGAESMRQLPTLKLFKIRMDLEMEGDTEALACAARGEPSRSSSSPSPTTSSTSP